MKSTKLVRYLALLLITATIASADPYSILNPAGNALEDIENEEENAAAAAPVPAPPAPEPAPAPAPPAPEPTPEAAPAELAEPEKNEPAEKDIEKTEAPSPPETRQFETEGEIMRDLPEMSERRTHNDQPNFLVNDNSNTVEKEQIPVEIDNTRASDIYDPFATTRPNFIKIETLQTEDLNILIGPQLSDVDNEHFHSDIQSVQQMISLLKSYGFMHEISQDARMHYYISGTGLKEPRDGCFVERISDHPILVCEPNVQEAAKTLVEYVLSPPVEASDWRSSLNGFLMSELLHDNDQTAASKEWLFLTRKFGNDFASRLWSHQGSPDIFTAAAEIGGMERSSLYSEYVRDAALDTHETRDDRRGMESTESTTTETTSINGDTLEVKQVHTSNGQNSTDTTTTTTAAPGNDTMEEEGTELHENIVSDEGQVLDAALASNNGTASANDETGTQPTERTSYVALSYFGVGVSLVLIDVMRSM